MFFIVFFFFLVPLWVFFVFGIVYLLDLDDKKTRCLKTIVNSSTNDPTTFDPLQVLHPNESMRKENIMDDDTSTAWELCRLIYHIDHKEPLPVGYELISNITYDNHIIGIKCRKKSTNQPILVFRGTATNLEWSKDLLFQQVKVNSEILTECKQVSFSAGLVHKGFFEIYSNLREQIANCIENDVLVSGHSLGSVLALFTLADFPNQVQRIYQFGAPLVGNKEFTNTLDATKITRYENRADIIPSLPLPVSPNFIGSPDSVFLYSHTPGTAFQFELNKGSFFSNHSLETYLQYFQSIQNI